MLKKIFNPYKEQKIEEKVRLVIYDIETKSYIREEIIYSRQSLEIILENKYNKAALKYKYQIIGENDRWKDTIHGYSYLFEKLTKQTIKGFNFSPKDIKNISLLPQFTEAEINYYFKNLLLIFYNFSLREPSIEKVEQVKRFLDALPYEIISSKNVAAHCYTQVKVMNNFVEADLNYNIFADIHEIGNDLIHKIEEKYISKNEQIVGYQTGLLVAIGNIYSLFSREKAYKKYQKALSLGYDYIDNFLTIDALSTYYTHIDKQNKSYCIIDDNVETQSDLLEHTEYVNICFSTDIKYFKMFILGWAQASFYYDELIFNFGIVTNNKKEYLHCVESYKEIIVSISNLLESDKPTNYRFFWIQSEIINKTVYACARFYLAYHLIKKYNGDIFITDIDQLVIGNLQKYLLNASTSEFSIYQPIMQRLYMLVPGRSHLAGNVYICNDANGQRYCQVLSDYVGLGLKEKFSWVLDQNATRYASEEFDIGNMFSFGDRVLKQYPELKRTLREQS
ncbi:hypothetical protein [Psychrobacter immobilis]|uniref:hypothetical protein n=1 Tax=Psychrobacter immobilis TaxID=498 RepID=UPI0019194F9E|nr:hypothetical protein [Psychrobacter immobilis]